jgi:ketosteroid isomerase-like protein
VSIPDDFQAMLDRTVAGEYRLYEGDSEPYLTLWSNEPDVTVLGAMGAYYRGPEQVRQNTEFVASHFHGGRNQRVEPLAMGASGELAFSVWIERGEARVAGRDDYAPLALRVTHIFRRESGGWKIIHRHGDAVTKQAQTPPVQ